MSKVLLQITNARINKFAFLLTASLLIFGCSAGSQTASAVPQSGRISVSPNPTSNVASAPHRDKMPKRLALPRPP